MSIKASGSGGSIKLSGTGGSIKFDITSGGGGIPVTSGLVVYLDAGNPASYPGSGTTWYDLSGNSQNATFTGTPTWNAAGYFTGFDASNYMTLDNTPYSVIPTGNASRTIIAAVETLSSFGGLRHIFHYGSQGSAQAFGLGSAGASLANHYWFGYTNESTQALSTSTFYVLGVNYNDTSSPRHKFSIDGVIGTTNNDQSMNTGTGFNPHIGTRIGPAESWDAGGKIYSIVVYDRDLSDAEMLQVSNYLAT